MTEELTAEMEALMRENRARRENRDTSKKMSSSDSSSTSRVLKDIKFNVHFNNKRETLKKRFSGDDTVRDVARAIADEITGDVDSVDGHVFGKRQKMDLHYDGKQLKMDSVLSSLRDIKGNNGLNLAIYVIFRVEGGATNKDRERLANFSDETRIKPTLKPDCIYGFNDKKLRVEMPCGHVFAPETLFKLTQMYVNNLNKCNISCPVLKCEQIWAFDVVVAAADLDDEEAVNFSNILSKRGMLNSGNYRECQGCKGFIKKPDDLTKIRVRCNAKSCANRSDFCWYCGKNWIGGGFVFCGNKECSTWQINDLLQNCKNVIPKYLEKENVECPEYRACPKCYNVVGWVSHCKHMRCWRCKHEFCFLCLAFKPEKGNWPCGYSINCGVKARQSLK